MRVELNESQMGELRLLIANIGAESNKLLARSLNKTAAKAKTLASVKIRQQVNLKAAYVKSKLTVHKATYGNLSARLSAEKRGVLMTRYPYTLKKRGATVKIKPGGPRKNLPGAFLVNLKAGEETVQALAWRDPRGGVYSTGHAKIIVTYSPSVSQVFNTVRDDINEELGDYLLTTAESELAAILRGY